ncbi:lysine exporter LysO family protein [Natronococcus occultus]|uniref:Putative membrane protein n=1 Tax=Natronococcus occultus SP4 TaxID=694430 RepID=L0K168_9EURY|nr:lysine exporter LysO family protein [Natronococcus occultus]AGB38741.1 putative membrane protein [Natronococcus occultus SP4]
MEIGLLLVVFLLGGILGFFSPFEGTNRVADGIVLVGLAVLLFAIGAQIGGDEQLFRNINTIGISAAILCVGSVIGSIACVYTSASFVLVDDGSTTSSSEESTSSPARGQPETTATESAGFDWKTTGIVFGSLSAGFVLSSVVLSGRIVTELESVSVSALWVLLFGVGLAVGSDTGSLGYVKRLGWGVFLIPVAIAVGSIVGGMLVGLAIGMPVSHGAAVAAGFGWYSYAGVIMFDLGGTELGAVAFLANLFREVLTLLIVPAIVDRLNGITSIAPGGATTMDVTLPLIQNAAGDEFVVPALLNGFVLSVFAVVLIPLFMQI